MDQRLEQGGARAGDARCHASPVTCAGRLGDRDRLHESHFVASRCWPDALSPPVGEGGALAAALDRHRCAPVAPPVSEVVGAVVAEDLCGQFLGSTGIARVLTLPWAEPGARLEPCHGGCIKDRRTRFTRMFRAA